jgi:hypothetical protein
MEACESGSICRQPPNGIPSLSATTRGPVYGATAWAKASSSIHLRSESDWPARMSLPKFSWMLHHSAFPGALSQLVFGPFDC